MTCQMNLSLCTKKQNHYQKMRLQYVLNKEIEMVDIFRRILVGCVQTGELELTKEQCHLYATSYCRSRTNVGIPKMGIA